MSKENENLFEGITIMSPQEVEETLDNSTDDNQKVEDNDSPKEKTEDVDLTIEPVSTDSSDKNAESNDDGSNTGEPAPSTESDAPANNNMYAAIIKDMIKDGVLNAGEEEELEELLKDANADTIKQLMSGTVNEAFKAKEDTWKKSMSGDKKRFLEIEDAFSNTDNAIQMAQRLEFFENVTEETIQEDKVLQQNLYYDYLKSKGFSDENAKEAIEEADAIDKLAEKAIKFLPELKADANKIVDNARAEKAAEKAAIIEQDKETYNNLVKTIDEKESFVPGLNLNKVAKEKLKNNITSPVHTDESGRQYTSLMYKQMRNPAGFEMLINYFDTIGLFNLSKEGQFKPDISKLKNIAKTAAVSEIDRVIAANNERGPGRAVSENASDKTQGIIDFLERATGKNSKKRK